MKRRSSQLARATTSACRYHLRGSLHPLSTTCAAQSSSATNTERPALPRLNLDDSTSSLLHDLHLGTGSDHVVGATGRRKYRRPLIMDEKDLEALNEARRVDGQEWVVTDAEDLLASDQAQTALEDNKKRPSESQKSASSLTGGPEHEGDLETYGREERRSPAAVFGSKRIGSVVLPEQLLDSIQRQIDGTSLHTSFLLDTDALCRTRRQTASSTSLPLATHVQIHLKLLATPLVVSPISPSARIHRNLLRKT